MKSDEPANMRRDYRMGELRRRDLANSPFEQFAKWFSEAGAAGVLEPNAMSLATAGADGAVSVRTVLMKAFDENGFVFFTNYLSDKAKQIEANPRVGLLFPWLALERQVAITGQAARVSREEAATYFASRPLENRLGAWASRQSEVVISREALEAQFVAVRERFPDGNVPLPDFWGGFRVAVETIEFWQGSAGRLHDRFRYSRSGNRWIIERLSP